VQSLETLRSSRCFDVASGWDGGRRVRYAIHRTALLPRELIVVGDYAGQWTVALARDETTTRNPGLDGLLRKPISRSVDRVIGLPDAEPSSLYRVRRWHDRVARRFSAIDSMRLAAPNDYVRGEVIDIRAENNGTGWLLPYSVRVGPVPRRWRDAP
jgi:hypothetical protein